MSGRSRVTLTPLALMALELLHERPMHPYEMHQVLRARQAGKVLKLSAGSLYHTIERMAGHGVIEVVETSREGRRPERTTYRITEAGRDAFADRLREIIAEPVDEFPIYPVGIGLLHTLDRDDALIQLRRREMDLAGRIATIKIYVESLGNRGVEDMYWIDTKLMLALQETELAWTTQFINDIDSGALHWPTYPGPDQSGETLRIIRNPAHQPDSSEGVAG
ncbi:MAG TPA: PadR family transcriptional regulator [Pseudonocardiaceae bacterium]